MCRIDQEGDEDPTDPRLGRIFETERLNLVLVNVGECNTTISGGFGTSKVLNTPVKTEKSVQRRPLMSSLIMTKRDELTDPSHRGCACSVCHLARGILARKLLF